MQLRLPDPKLRRRYIAHDGYQVQFLPECDSEGLAAFHFVVKRCHAIEPDAPARPETVQRALHLADVFHDEQVPLQSSIRYESDLSPPKPKCDVFVVGHCYAPGGETVQCVASLNFAGHVKRALVIGDRSAWWRPGMRRPALQAARPFHAIPLRWEYAYGGVDTRHSLSPIFFPANPVGTGFWTRETEYAKPAERYGALPNIEHPDRPLTLDELFVAPGDVDGDAAPQPVGFGVVARTWTPRAKYAGVDPKLRPLWEMFRKIPRPGIEQMPMPIMSPAFLNAAPADQQVPHPQGGETVVLTHMHPIHRELRFRLPVARPIVRFDCGRGMTLVPLKIDTVLIEPDTMALDLVWRGTLPSPEGLRMDKLEVARIEVDGQPTLPAPLLDTGFPLELLTGGAP